MMRNTQQRGLRRGGLVVALSLATMLSGCDMAPRYKPTPLKLPESWGNTGVLKAASPSDAAIRSDWWTMLGDPVLNQLEAQAMRLNPDLQAQAEAFMQARDVAMEAKSHLYPQLNGGAGGEKYKGSRHRLWRGGTSQGPIYMSSEQYSATATWEPDFWSAIRNRVRMTKQRTEEAAADYALARLSLQAELASDYVVLRGLDAQSAVYRDSIRYYQTAVQVTKMRLAGAIAPGMDVSRAEAQLYTTQAQETDIQTQREVMEHAIAVLVNQAPATFHIAPTTRLNFTEIQPPVALPATLLERRPDIAASERRMAQANRAIGVSRAAFYPHVTFNAMTGFMDRGFDLASLSNSMYQFGVQALMPLFQGGLRRAELQRNWSQYRQQEDEYRSTVLSAFQEVQDNLTRTTRLKTEAAQQSNAVDAALRTQNMTMALYTGGLTNYLDVVVAQVAALQARIALVQVQTRAVDARVELIRALGGGWSRAELPKSNEIMPFHPLQYGNLRHAAPVAGITTQADPAAANLVGEQKTP
ncbi:MAG: efflux transporter outer membrane subunit [Acetobacter orientalis]|uniref:Secretion system type I outer membrane efflux pump lipoprotein NodT n=3 Tax=Acetobacter orientalis TaxID=146474 RepID=A0A0D6NLR8_9PROT|nr:efflux transporter outer membrane subunit [Acetobacter orientalis]GAN66994.1 secretion system type I outer membrane efflux pump lipoprotein NodT [Acetobacter orientalis]GBR17030.1 secretion system type I outer membrane efflux pump lipoprotein NodT [Acetobacter orientalis NRIC 0481]GEL60232.1 outer membrane efflux lipoprotein [Acetobacter orientalis]